jgi:hypothetical protein
MVEIRRKRDAGLESQTPLFSSIRSETDKSRSMEPAYETRAMKVAQSPLIEYSEDTHTWLVLKPLYEAAS